ncbi:MAG: FtsW/RodA/SpoVE family cell cycle protein [Eubacteriales bacterium]|nr:FtsW/RodA/SpoVE family cell cycle protein [Eubacteriales bacterium]
MPCVLISPAYFSYLSRYITGVFFALAALLLVVAAYRRLRQRLVLHRHGVDHYFLLGEQEGQADGIIHYPLYFSTSLGKARSSDIQLKGRGIQRHHAIIYLYKGAWYLDRSSARALVKVNGREVKRRQRLRHEDVISLGRHDLSFFDEAKAAKKSGLALAKVEERLALDHNQPPSIASLLLALYLPLAILQVAFVLPSALESLLPSLLLLSGLFMLLILSSALLWPRIFGHFDSLAFTCFALLMSLGFVIQMRLSLLNRTMPVSPDWHEGRWLDFLQADMLKQALFPLLGLGIMPVIILLVTRTKLLERLAPLSLFLTPLFYLSSIVLGSDVTGTGTRLWIRLPMGLTIQPSEFAKITYLLVLAWTFKVRLSFKRQLLFFAWAAANFFLILLLPDLGSLMILLPVSLVVFLVMTSEYLETALLLLGGSAVFFVAYQIFPYVQRRIYGWLTLWTEVNAQNDQIIRGLKAMARGGLVGLGCGQAEPRAIPLASSDMIFPFLVEEQGLLVGLAIVVCFMALWLRGAHAFIVTRDSFSAALILGLASSFFFEAAVVIAGSTGLVPLTGVTLPFIARGGSSMLAKYLMAGLLLGLANRQAEVAR